MRFRFTGSIRGFLLQPGNNLTIPFEGPHKVVVELRHATNEEVEQGYAPQTTYCFASSEWDVSAKNRAAFDSLTQRRLPEGWNRAEGWEQEVDEEGRFKKVDIVSLELLPQSFQDFARQILQELTDSTVRAVGIVRWRRNQSGPHNPLSHVRFSWSVDGQAWNHMPSYFGAIMEVISAISSSEEFINEIVNLINNEHDEPVGHKLFREAWENKLSDPRSSLLVGIAAAEVGFKHFVTSLVPETRWLIENTPSPPIVTMLSNYLPLLPAKNTINGKVLPPPKDEILDILKKGVLLRNKATHTAAEEPSYKTLEEVLLAVRDVLWLMDYYRGFGWALLNVRPEVRSKMGVNSST